VQGEEGKTVSIRQKRPLTRRVVIWAIGFVMSVAAMLAGGSIFLWSASSDSRGSSFGATVLALGFLTAVITCVGAWLSSRRSGCVR
jgi:hypothetical protein